MGAKDAPRKSYLRYLLKEYDDPDTSKDCKSQVLANLSNFAYDPSNSAFIRDLGILDAFLEQLTNPTRADLTLYACSGVCNLCLDPENSDYIVKLGGVKLLENHTSSDCIETALNAISSLIYLSERHSLIRTNIGLARSMLNLKNSTDVRLKNLATIFLNDCIDRDFLENISKGSETAICDIPPSKEA